MKFFGRGIWALGLWLAVALLAGCNTERYNPMGLGPDTNSTDLFTNETGGGKPLLLDQTQYRLRVGDDLVVTFLDLNPPMAPVPATVKDDGSISLINGQEFQAKDKTITELQADIYKKYIPAYYKNLTVNITIVNRFYSVTGYVMQPNKVAYTGPIRLLEAINSAGGPNEFANMHKVTVTRENGVNKIVDCIKAKTDQKLNIWIFPGDRIDVPKSWF